jgi:hypothetical protein
MERSFDAERANEILNDPEVRPFVTESPGCPLDVTKQVADRNNFLYLGENGLTLYVYLMPGTYEVHSACLKSGRGSWMKKFARDSLDAIFSQSLAWEVCTRIPKGNLAALTLSKSCGFQFEFDSLNPCVFNGQSVIPATWRLSLHDWVKKSDYFLEVGEWLHSRLAEEAKKLGIEAPPHEEDDHHNRVAGASLAMARAGNATKALYHYSRWAVLARHASISLASADPVVFQMDIGFLRLKGDDIEVTRE